MNKSRVEAFTDAVVAIIMTIMVLEFKTPASAKFSALVHELPYLFAYMVSFLFISVAWYNHHYMFSLANRISKKIYWVNNFWILSMSIIPFGTSWVGAFMNSRGPEYFYLAVFSIWSIAYWWLSREIMMELHINHPKTANKIYEMPIYKFLNSFKSIFITLIIIVMIYFIPEIGIFGALAELTYFGLKTTKDSDRLFSSN